MGKTIGLLLSFVLLLPTAVSAEDDLNIQNWLDDFSELKEILSDTYPNLRDKTELQSINLPDLSAEVIEKIKRAETSKEMKAIFNDFIRKFDDAHLRIKWPSKVLKKTAGVSDEAVSKPNLCAAVGAFSWRDKRALQFSNATQWSAINTQDSAQLPIGILTLDNEKIGTIRIGLFMSLAFPVYCDQAKVKLNIQDEGDCDGGCQQDLYFETENMFTEALVRQVNVLQELDIDTLLIDVTGNGGGSDWSEVAARVLTKNTLASPKVAFIAHEHWQKYFERSVSSIKYDVTEAGTARRPIAEKALAMAESGLKRSKEMCDRSGVWETNTFPECTIEKQGSLYSSGFVSNVKTSDTELLDGLESKASLFLPSLYRYTEGVYGGKLMVVTDRKTASSAELFSALLRDSNSAELIGETTMGIGCGYISGKIKQVLSNSEARIIVPNCKRYRSDGTNEAVGISPDHVVDWLPEDTQTQRVEKLISRLQQRDAS